VVSPNGERFACGSDDKTVWIWNSATGAQIRRVRSHTDKVKKVLFFPDGKRGLSVDDRGVILFWEPDNDDEPRQLPIHSKEVDLSSDGSSLVFTDEKGAVVYDLQTGTESARFAKHRSDQLIFYSHPTISTDLSVSAIVKTFGGSPIQVWDLATGALKWESPTNSRKIHTVRILPDGTKVLALDGMTLRIWEITTGDEVGRFAVGDEFRTSCMAIHPDGGSVVFGTQYGDLVLARLP
jgi:WD40 repeat protein